MHVENVNVRRAKLLQTGFKRQMHRFQVISNEHWFLFDGCIVSVEIGGVLTFQKR
jgi:hypothetical protein